MSKTIEITIHIPEYLYKLAENVTNLGLFQNMSELINTGLRHELALTQRLLPPENDDWQTQLNQIRFFVWQKQQASGKAFPSEESVIEELRAIRRTFCENEYQLQKCLK